MALIIEDWLGISHENDYETNRLLPYSSTKLTIASTAYADVAILFRTT